MMASEVLSREHPIIGFFKELFAFLNPAKEKQESEKETDFYYLDRYGDHLLRLAMSYVHNQSDAEDIVQETMIQLIRKAPEFENEEHEKAWLYRVTINLSKNRLKANGRRRFEPLPETLTEETPEDFGYLWEAVAQLPEIQRSALHFFYYEGFSTKEIAQLLEMKESTLRSHLHRGRNQLEQLLKGEAPDETNLS